MGVDEPERCARRPRRLVVMPRGESALSENVRGALESHGYMGRRARLVVGVSGGPDSTALLSALVELRESCVIEIHVVHIDHGLRQEAGGDATYVKRLCARWSVPVTVRRVDVDNLRREERLSIEEAARKARHTVFLEEATATGAEAIVLGHTADDQVETALLNLLRGAGLRGLAGMAEQAESAFTGIDGERMPIIRPLLGVTRTEVMHYLRGRRLRPREDASNTDPAHLRNRVRHELLPLLEDIRMGASQAIGRASEDARLALEYMESQAGDVWRKACDTAVDGQSIRIDRNVLRGARGALRHVVLERAVVAMLGSAEGLSRANYMAMDALIMGGRTGSKLTLPHDLRLSCVSGSQAVLSIGEPPVPIAHVEEAELCLEGETLVGGWTFTSRAVECGIELNASAEGAELLPGPLRVVVGQAGERRQLRVRTRESGDRIRLSGGHRKVQDVFVDRKIPQAWRDNIPIVCDAETGDILWLTGVAVAAGVTPVK